MCIDEPVTAWIQQLGADDQVALQELWRIYYPRLVALARGRLQGAPRQMVDEEDAALSAFKSFCRGVEQGRFPRLADRHDLWQVLVMLTLRKASNQARNARTQKGGGGRVQNASALDRPGEEEGRAFAEQISREPDPAFAFEVAQRCRWLLAQLRNDTLRSVALGKLEGSTNEELARQFGCAKVTVARWLNEIREAWRKNGEE
jgi:DNA-directed RNA polymerase specialized sigma24 family protein